jgi:acylphosphatase
MPGVARHLRIVGRVQGVFFRAWAQEQAGSLGVSGWVRNCSDGSVEARLEGEESAVDRMIERLSQGPSGARVDDLEVEKDSPENVSNFEIRH